jgi:hypothetical protein
MTFSVFSMETVIQGREEESLMSVGAGFQNTAGNKSRDETSLNYM